VSATEVTVQLDAVESMFAVDRPDYFSETTTLVPGVEQLLGELRPRRVDNGVRVIVELPPGDVAPDQDERLTAAIGRYCQTRIRTLDDQLRALRREGMRALVIGFLMLAAGLALSQATSNSDLPESLRVFFGDGVFLVAAWVGIWYPLDTLIYIPGPLRRDRQVLEALGQADVVVRAA
jgi:hypothetical protein